MQATDTSAIQRLISQARLRIRGQAALEGATTATVLAAALALIAIFSMRTELVRPTAGLGMLIAAGVLIVLGAMIGATRKVNDEAVARRIDRASGLSDRLSTAIAFDAALASEQSTASAGDEVETRALMIAAIKDGVRAAPRANVKAATPFTTPRDLRAAFGFLVVSALAAGLMIPRASREPRLFGVEPNFARPGEIVHLRGQNLLAGLATPMASLPASNAMGAPSAAITAPVARPDSYVPRDGAVFIGPTSASRPVQVLDWTATAVAIRIPDDAKVGDTLLTAYLGKRMLGPVEFTVVDPKDQRFHNADAVLLDADERDYVASILKQLRAEHVPELDAFADKVEKLLEEAEQGKVTKEQLLDGLAKAEEALAQHKEPNQAEIEKAMSEIGKEMAKDKVTAELGKALMEHDLQKAKAELEKLGDRLDPDAEKELEKLTKQLENKDLSLAQKTELKQQIEDLKKQLQDKNLSPAQKQDLEKKIAEIQKQLENQNLTPEQKAELQKKIDDIQKQLENQNLTPEQKAELQKQLADAKKDLQNKNLTPQQKQDLENKLAEQQAKLANKELTPAQKAELQNKLAEAKKQLENKRLTPEQRAELQKKLEQLAQQKPMTEQEKQQLQQKLAQVAKQMSQKSEQQQQQQSAQQQKTQDEIRRLEKKKEEAKTDKERQQTERQLQKKKDELQKLQKDQDEKQQSAQREALKRLQKDIEKAAENLDKKAPKKDQSKDERDEEQKERDRQASRSMKDAARETGRVDQDQRKQAAQKKLASQMDDLREAMRRAKQKGNKGPNDPFNKNGKNKDFQSRSRGGKGQGGQAWKPGQGKDGQGKGPGDPSGGGPGTEHDPNLVGDSTQKSGNAKDQDLQGVSGNRGSSRRETILSAAQKGFSSTSYEKVYADYQKIVEEVMRTEKMPASYKYYVKRYFAKIHPNTEAPTE